VASAVVVNTGSMGSHAMIVARELGIPCVAGLPGATKMLKTGDLVRVDGATGTVEVLEAV
jgi:phosphoenolpyruvate synthase/pyruvate phosphate dikinase